MFLSTTPARLPLGTRFLEPSYALKVLPQRFRRYFVAFFLRLVALFCSLWVGGFPLAAFFPSPALVALPSSGWVGAPCRVFLVFSPRSGVGGGAILSVFFACCLLRLASL